MRFAWLVALVATALLACDDGTGDAPGTTQEHDAATREDGGRAPVPIGCAEDLDLCDIREPACQEAIAEAVACLRESRVHKAPVQLISEDDYADLLSSGPGFQTLPLVAQRWRNGLALLGLVKAEFDLGDIAADNAEWTGAAYMPMTREILVIDRGMPLDDVNTMATLAHEMVHAMQDEERDILAWSTRWSQSEDSALAAAAVMEGEAMHYQVLFNLQLVGKRSEDFDWDRMYADWQQQAIETADADESAFDLSRGRFVYPFGGAFVTRAWLERGTAGVEALMVRPPRTSHEVMFGRIDGTAQAMIALSNAALAAPPSEEYLPVTFSDLGAWNLRAFLRRAGLDEDDALQGARSLGADFLSVLVRLEDEAPVAVWRLRQLPDTDRSWSDAISLADAKVWTDADDVFIVAGPEMFRDVAQDLEWLSLQPTQPFIPAPALPAAMHLPPLR